MSILGVTGPLSTGEWGLVLRRGDVLLAPSSHQDGAASARLRWEGRVSEPHFSKCSSG